MFFMYKLNLLKIVFLITIFAQSVACSTNYRLGLKHLESHNYPEALEYFEKDAALGYRAPAIYAADLYIIDYQIPRDIQKSKNYLDMALKADYGRYDQALDYYLPLIKAYQILADDKLSDKTEAFNMLQYEKYHEFSWPLYVLGHCYLVGYGVDKNIVKAKNYFERAYSHRITDHQNAFYAWWLSVNPDKGFRDPKRALEIIRDAIDDNDINDTPSFNDTLAAVYAVNGDFDQAIYYQEIALSLLKEKIKKYAYMSEHLPGFEMRLAFYLKGVPWIYTEEEVKLCGYDVKRCLKVLPNGLMENHEETMGTELSKN